jgi:prophage antirepressor-like protein
MNNQTAVKLFEAKTIRTAWNEDAEEWYFSVIDVVEVLTESPDPKRYWSVLKARLKQEGIEGTTICSTLKLVAQDGKMRLTDVASTEQIFRIFQSIPSPKAEPFKQWLAHVGKERIDQLQDPELSIEQAMTDYQRLGYSDNWINQRLKSIEIRKDLTDEWKKHGLQEGTQFASLTDIIYKTWAGKTAKEYKQFKGLKKENLRDNMTNKELVINMLAELSTKEISEVSNPETMPEHEDIARRGGNIARDACLKLEAETGKKVVSPLNAKNVLEIGNENE